MNIILKFIFAIGCIFISLGASANWIPNEIPFDLEKAFSNEETVPQGFRVAHSYATGNINNKEYLIAALNNLNDTEAVVAIYIKQNNNYKLLNKSASYMYSGGNPKIKILKDSIYITEFFAHNGVYFKKYQFRLNKERFELIGFEWQGMTLLGYELDRPENESKDFDPSLEMWRGQSVNLLTKKSNCWLAVLDHANPKCTRCKDSMKRFDNTLRPVRVDYENEIQTKLKKRYFLDGFNFDEFAWSDLEKSTCYIDKYKAFHKKHQNLDQY